MFYSQAHNEERRSGIHWFFAFNCDRNLFIEFSGGIGDNAGRARVQGTYSKAWQWAQFIDLVARIEPC